jgi:hypothetical protein
MLNLGTIGVEILASTSGNTPAVFTDTEVKHQGYAFKHTSVSIGSKQPTEKLKAQQVGIGVPI